MSLRSFIEETESPETTIAVVGDETPKPLESMLAETFEEQPLVVESRHELESELAAETTGETVVLLEDGIAVASSSMTELYDAILAINSDLYVTGAEDLGEVELPDVLAGLDEFQFTLRGYPLAHKEKLLLIVISRYIEQLAWETNSGTLRTSFQQLTRLEDEVGTRAVYESLAETDLDVHVYGVGPDGDSGNDEAVPIDADLSAHTGTSSEYRNSWFVVFDPATPTEDAAALVALETEPRIWDGFWTYDHERVSAIEEYIATSL